MLRYPRTSQPKGGAKPEIDWNNPLTRGLAGVVLPHIGELIQHGTVSPRANAHYLAADPSGNIGLRDGSAGASNSGWRYPGSFGRPSGELTVFSVSRMLVAPSTSSREAGNFQGGTAQGSYCLAPNASNFRLFYIDSTGTNRTATGAAIDTKLHIHIGTVTASQIAIYTDGILGGTATPTALGSAITGSDFEILGDSGNGISVNSIVFMAGVFHRALSASEVAAFARNPWQLFKSIVVPVKAPAAGAYTLTADNAAWNFAAQDAALKVARKLTAANAPWEFAAQSAGLTVARKITADNAAWEFAAQDATLTYAPAGAYTLVADSADWQFSVPDATLTYSGATTRRRGAAKPLRKGYIIRGKKYFLTDDELAIMVALELETIKRSDIKVPTKGRIKPIPAATFQMVKAVAKKMDELAEIGSLEDDDDEEEELLSMLL